MTNLSNNFAIFDKILAYDPSSNFVDFVSLL